MDISGLCPLQAKDGDRVDVDFLDIPGDDVVTIIAAVIRPDGSMRRYVRGDVDGRDGEDEGWFALNDAWADWAFEKHGRCRPSERYVIEGGRPVHA